MLRGEKTFQCWATKSTACELNDMCAMGSVTFLTRSYIPGVSWVVWSVTQGNAFHMLSSATRWWVPLCMLYGTMWNIPSGIISTSHPTIHPDLTPTELGA